MASSKQFGLVGVQSDPNSPLGYSPCAVGCCLSVRSCNTLPDGRSIIDTIGKARFRIVDNWEQDGYLVGKVVWLNDVLPSSEAERQQLQRTLQQLVDRVRALYARFASSTACASLSRLLQRITEMPDMGTTVEQWVRLSYWLCDTLPVDLQTKQHLVRTENIYAILGNRRQRCRELTCQRTRSLAVPQHSSRSTRVWNVCKRSKNAWIAQETHTAAHVPSCSAAISLALSLSCSLCQSFIARVFVYSIVCVCHSFIVSLVVLFVPSLAPLPLLRCFSVLYSCPTLPTLLQLAYRVPQETTSLQANQPLKQSIIHSSREAT